MQSHMGLCGLHDNAALQHVPMRPVNISGDFGDAAPGGALVHEMAHLQQHHFGKPSRMSYHNKEWARR